MAEDFFSHFQIVRDPRIERTKKHPLESIFFVAICGVICGADSWIEIAQFGEDKEEWLRRPVELPHGIPSHDTFGRVFALLDPEEFQTCLRMCRATGRMRSFGKRPMVTRWWKRGMDGLSSGVTG